MATKPKIIKMEDLPAAKPVAVEESIDEVALVPAVAEEVDDDEAEYTSNPPSGYSASDVAKDIHRLGTELVDLYSRYTKVHTLAREMNGLPDSAPLPQQIKIHNISFTYSIDGKTQTTLADLISPSHVGEISHLLMSEIERIVDDITNHLTKIRELATASEQACTQAKFYNRMAQSKNVPV